MGIPSKSSWLRRTRVLWLVGATALLIPGFLWGGDLLASAQSSTSGADLAQQYLAALGPAGTAISTAEAKLKALPITASVAQVQAVVAPLPKALGPLEALIKTSGPSPTGTSLQSLGSPTITGQNGEKCNSYNTQASGGRLVIGGTEYQDGFQMISSQNCQEGHAQYTWQIGTKYTSFTAQIGYDLTNSCAGSGVRFLGNNSQRLPFMSNGRITETLTIPAKGLASVSVNLAHETQLTVQVLFGCIVGANYTNYLGGLSAVDVVNNQLS
jgi:hypothetical protein